MTLAIAFDNLSADESESEPTTETSGGVIMFMMASVMALLMIFALEGMSVGLHGLVQRKRHYTIQPKTEKANKIKCEQRRFVLMKKDEKNGAEKLQFVVFHVC